MIIGNFTYDKAKDTYEGNIRTLTVSRNSIVFKPLEAKGDKAPHYRVTCEGESGTTEVGAAWKRKSEQGREYLSVSLDDPTFEQPLSAALMPSEDGSSAILIWSRSNKREASATCGWRGTGLRAGAFLFSRITRDSQSAARL